MQKHFRLFSPLRTTPSVTTAQVDQQFCYIPSRNLHIHIRKDLAEAKASQWDSSYTKEHLDYKYPWVKWHVLYYKDPYGEIQRGHNNPRLETGDRVAGHYIAIPQPESKAGCPSMRIPKPVVDLVKTAARNCVGWFCTKHRLYSSIKSKLRQSGYMDDLYLLLVTETGPIANIPNGADKLYCIAVLPVP